MPASVQTILGTVCKDIPGSFNDTSKWVYPRGIGKCDTIHPSDLERHDVRLANQIVFAFQVSDNNLIDNWFDEIQSFARRNVASILITRFRSLIHSFIVLF